MNLNGIELMGWAPQAKMDWILKWIEEHKPSVVCEIGVFGGASLLPMAYACREWPNKTIGIDSWSVEACLEGMTGAENREWWERRSELGRVETSCRQAIRDLGLTNVELWVDVSDVYKDSFQDNEIGLLSIDGNHGAQALIDGQNYLRKVKVGGLIAADDVWWLEHDVHTVKAMVDWLCANGCRNLCEVEGCAMLEKVA